MKEDLNRKVISIGVENSGSFTFLQKSYDETVELLAAVTEYFKRYGKRDRFGLTQHERIVYTVAMSTITVQLTSVLSWLLAQKAVEKGEITAVEARSERYRLQHIEGYTREEEDTVFEILNNPIPQMLKRSAALYGRIKRLEQSMDARTPEMAD